MKTITSAFCRWTRACRFFASSFPITDHNMSDWRLAKSLVVLRDRVNALAPNRSKDSDGSVGDSAHASRSSDHNPYIKDNGIGVVRAIDITHDPRDGFDSYAFADMLRKNADPRIKYIISNRRIANPGESWRPYHGSNPHDHHVHISVSVSKSLYDDTSPWKIDGIEAGTDIPAVLADTASPKPSRPFLKMGSHGEDVKRLQKLLGVTVDGDFGAKTRLAVCDFQSKHKLVADGIVGGYTHRALEAA